MCVLGGRMTTGGCTVPTPHPFPPPASPPPLILFPPPSSGHNHHHAKQASTWLHAPDQPEPCPVLQPYASGLNCRAPIATLSGRRVSPSATSHREPHLFRIPASLATVQAQEHRERQVRVKNEVAMPRGCLSCTVIYRPKDRPMPCQTPNPCPRSHRVPMST